MKIDFHVHSRYSDGEYDLDALGKMAKDLGLGGFAITDHDTVKGWQDIKEIEKKYGIIIIPGVEISTEWEEKDVHILAYGLSENSKQVLSLLDRLSVSRMSRIRTMVERFNDLGFEFTEKDVFDIADNDCPGRPHIAKIMIEKGYAETSKEVFRKYISRGGSCYVPREKIDPFDCVKMIQEEGAYAVLAHPGIDYNYKLLPELKKWGLWGVEVYHSSHSPGEEIRFKQMAKDLNLKIFAGSDFHSLNLEGHGNLGTKFIELENIADMFR